MVKEFTESNYRNAKIWFYFKSYQKFFSHYGISNNSLQNISSNNYNFVYLDVFSAYVSNM